MTGDKTQDPSVSDWWRTGIIEMRPGVIRFRGRPIEELIGEITFPQMIWLLLRGDLPSKPQAELLEAALVAAVDHGPQAPSIAAARMAATCGVALNHVMATAVNMLGDVHGGAGEECVDWLLDIRQTMEGAAERDKERLLSHYLDERHADGAVFVPGFGHRFHKPVDPRAPRLLALVDEAAAAGTVSGEFAEIARLLEAELLKEKGKPVPMNIDGATAVIFAELGFAAPLARGLFCISRSVGALAHGWEQMQEGGRNKGPIPRGYLPSYIGPQEPKA